MWRGTVNGAVINDDGVLGELDRSEDFTCLVPKGILDQAFVTSGLERVDLALHVVFIFEGSAVIPRTRVLHCGAAQKAPLRARRVRRNTHPQLYRRRFLAQAM